MIIKEMVGLIFKLIMCHLVGDYILQIDYIAKTKGENPYHLCVHCFLYLLPFYFVLGMEFVPLGLLFATHLIIDELKSKFHVISYATDQLLHYAVLVLIVVYKMA